MPESRTLLLQRSLAALALDPDIPGAPGLGEFQEGLQVYRELVRMGLADPVEATFPVTKALLEGESAWEGCIDAFLEARCVRSPHHRDIAPAFLGWLAETGWGRERWPFLLELAHFELLETLVYRFEDERPPQGLESLPGPGSRAVLDSATQVVSYGHAVHRATEENPTPDLEPTHLLAYRDPEGECRILELTAATALLLREGQNRPVGEVVADMGVPDFSETRALLADLRKAGAIAGFRGMLTPE